MMRYLYSGGTGVGKSVIARGLLESIASEHNYIPVYMNFSAQTASNRVQEFIESKLERRKKSFLSNPTAFTNYTLMIFIIIYANTVLLNNVGLQYYFICLYFFYFHFIEIVNLDYV